MKNQNNLLKLLLLTIILFNACSGQNSEKSSQVNEDSLKASQFYEKAFNKYIEIITPVSHNDTVALIQAVSLIDSSLKFMPDKQQYLDFKATLYLSLGKHNEALEVYKYQYYNIDSVSNTSSFQLGLLSYHINEPDYQRYFENALRVYNSVPVPESNAQYLEMDKEILSFCSLFFIDSLKAIDDYNRFMKKHRDDGFDIGVDLNTCTKEDLVRQFLLR